MANLVDNFRMLSRSIGTTAIWKRLSVSRADDCKEITKFTRRIDDFLSNQAARRGALEREGRLTPTAIAEQLRKEFAPAKAELERFEQRWRKTRADVDTARARIARGELVLGKDGTYETVTRPEQSMLDLMNAREIRDAVRSMPAAERFRFAIEALRTGQDAIVRAIETSPLPLVDGAQEAFAEHRLAASGFRDAYADGHDVVQHGELVASSARAALGFDVE